jgi:hypothetical protein
VRIQDGQNVRAFVFVKIELNGKTLRFATENINAKDLDGVEYFWEGRVVTVDGVTAGFNDFKNAQTMVSSLQISLANGKSYSSDTNLDSDISSYFWGLRPCTIFLGVQDLNTKTVQTSSIISAWRAGAGQYAGPQKKVGSTFIVTTHQLAASDIILKGIISFPNVFSDYSDQLVSFSVLDQRYTDQIYAAPSFFKLDNTVTSSSLLTDTPQDGVVGQRIPIVYGAFDDPVIKSFGIRGFPGGDGTNSGQLYYQVADDSILAAGQVSIRSYFSSAFIPSDVNGVVDITNVASSGVFYVDSSFEYDANASTLYVKVEGKTRGTQIAAVFTDNADATALLEHPVEVLYDLLVNRLGVDTTGIDENSFTSVKAIDSTAVCRRWISDDALLVDTINELCFEFGYELYSLIGKFYLKKQTLLGSTTGSFTQDDLMPQTYQLQLDPNRAYFNQLTLRFNQRPSDGEFLGTTQISNYAKVSQHSKLQNFALDLQWSYREFEAIERFSILLAMFSGPIRLLTATFVSSAWGLKPADILDLTFHIFTAQTFLVRSATKDLNTFSTAITAWDLGTTHLKNWALDADTTPTTYANASAATFGVYHADAIIEKNFNSQIKVTTTTSATVDIPPSSYSSVTLLASAIQTAINAAVGTDVTVSYNATTRKFTIATVDSSNFTLHWTDTPEIGRSVLGFDVSSNDTGANSYTSDYISIFDLVDGEIVSAWG